MMKPFSVQRFCIYALMVVCLFVVLLPGCPPPDNNPDKDNDGMLDSWELTHFGTLARDGSADFDTDGLRDLDEFNAGEDPTCFTPYFLWANTISGTGRSYGVCAAVHPDESAVIVGKYYGSITLGEKDAYAITFDSMYGFYVARYNKDGTLRYATAVECSAPISALSVDAMPDGGVVVTGAFTGEATFGPGELNETTLTSQDAYDDMFLARYASNGALIWVTAATGDRCHGWELAAASGGYIYIIGTFRNAITLGAGEVNETTLVTLPQQPENISTPFLAQYTFDGALRWAAGVYPNGDNHTGLLEVLPDNSVLIGGGFDNCSITLGAGELDETVISASDVPGITYLGCLAKYDPNGVLQWVSVLEGLPITTSAHRDGSFYLLAGLINPTVRIGIDQPNETTIALTPHKMGECIARYNADGTVVWAKLVSEGTLNLRNSMQLLSDGSLAVVGDFYQGTFGLGTPHETTLSNSGNDSIYFGRYDSLGSLLWLKQFPNMNMSYALGLQIQDNHHAIITGDLFDSAVLGAGEPNEVTIVPETPGNDCAFILRHSVLPEDGNADGLPDQWAFRYGITLPGDDPDGDGLSNLQEAQYRSNPHEADTDGDGLSDAYEINVSLTLPYDSDSDHDGISDYDEAP